MPAVDATLSSLTEAAVHCRTQLEFRREAVRQLSSVVGFDVAFVGRMQGGPPLLVDVKLASWKAFVEHTPRMIEELMPLMCATLAQRRVALDTDVIAQRARNRSLFYEHCIRPNGARAFVSVHLSLRGEETTIMHLGRTRHSPPYRPRDLEHLRRFVPLLSLGDGLHDPRPAADPVGGAVLEDPGWLRVTAREREIAEHAALGLTNGEIATACATSANTVRNQLASVYAKLDVANRTDLARIMLQERGVIAMPRARLARLRRTRH